MRTNKKTSTSDVLKWAGEARLDLPDRWERIQQNLAVLHKSDLAMDEDGNVHHQHQSINGKKRLLVVFAGLAVLVIVAGLFFSGSLGRWFWPSDIPGNHYTPMTTRFAAVTEPAGPTTPASTYSDEQLAFSDRANVQFDLMKQAHIPDQYKYYAGCYIEDLKIFVIAVTGNPEDFKAAYADLLDFRIIEVRQVRYTLKELELAYEPFFQEWLNSDKLTQLGVIGHCVGEKENAILIVVKQVTDDIRKEVARIIPDTDMVVFEVNTEIVPY